MIFHPIFTLNHSVDVKYCMHPVYNHQTMLWYKLLSTIPPLYSFRIWQFEQWTLAKSLLILFIIFMVFMNVNRILNLQLKLYNTLHLYIHIMLLSEQVLVSTRLWPCHHIHCTTVFSVNDVDNRLYLYSFLSSSQTFFK